MKSAVKIFLLVAFMVASGYAEMFWVNQSKGRQAADATGMRAGGEGREGAARSGATPSIAPRAEGSVPAAASRGNASPADSATSASIEKSSAPAPPGGMLDAEVYTLRPERFTERLPAYGSLSANETVEITTELQGRLKRIHAQDGDLVESGRPLFEFDTTELEAQLRELEVREKFAGIRENRLKTLLDEKVISPQEYDEAKSSTEAFTAQIEALKVRIEKMRVLAPFSGQLGLRKVSLGAWVEPGDVMTTLQDISRIKVDFKVPERYSGFVHIDAPLRFRVEGQDDWSSATVTAIQPQVEEDTRSLLVRGVSANPRGRLLPGAFVTVELEVSSSNDALLIPSEAVIPTAVGASVYVDDAGRVDQREVLLGMRTADRVQVLNGLSAGQRVIVSNLLRLKPGMAVNGRASN